ncbi:MAG: amidohydrolase family protein [Pyrinomonadaceae bacterium]|nr:amidohydrolase family protein [Pyrinomonadaceae bacterium]
MKKLFRIFKIFAITVTFSIVLMVILLALGVNLPKQEYLQKETSTPRLAIKNCSIVDVSKGKIIPNQTLIVEDGKIVYADSALNVQIGENFVVLDGTGKFIIPGLRDMHAHTLSLSPQLHFPLLIANGVTGVRDMGDGNSWVSDINDNSPKDKEIWELQVAEKNLLMPKIFEATSFHLEEVEGLNETNSNEKIKELISKLKANGEPFVKMQLDENGLSTSLFYQILEESKRQNINILGHLPENVDVFKVLDNDYKSIEHAWALIPHFSRDKQVIEKEIAAKKHQLETQDSELANQILKKMAEKNVFYTPTHVTSNKKEAFAFDANFAANPNNQYVENVQLSIWKLWAWLHTNGFDETNDRPVLEKYYQRGLEITKQANQNGVKILAGTDALDRYVYYGFSLHDELQEMVKAGLSQADALKTATIYPAEYFGNDDSFGTIEKGKVADFIILNSNPLENISNTKDINSVYHDQKLYDSTDLEAMKSFTHSQAKSFGISAKFVWNMIKGLVC